MQNIGSGGWYVDYKGLFRCGGIDGCRVAHFLQVANHFLWRKSKAGASVDVVYACVEPHIAEVWGDLGLAIRIDDFDGLNGKRFSAVLAEHGNDDVDHDPQLRLVNSSSIDEDVLRVERDLRVVRVDNGWHTQHLSVAIVDDGVDGRITNDVQVPRKMLVTFVELHHLTGIVLLLLVERSELDLFGRKGFVAERSLDGVQVMRADSDQRPASREILMQLILQIDKVGIALRRESDVPQHCACEVRPDLGHIRAELDLNELLRIGEFELRLRNVSQKHVERTRDALVTEQIVSVGRNIDLELSSFAKTGFGDFFGCIIVELDTELEAEFVEFLGGVGASERFVEVLLVDADGRHGGEMGCSAGG